MNGPTKVQFIPVKDGDVIEEDSPEAGIHFVGFKPGRAGKREGWLVYLVHTNPSTIADTSWGRPHGARKTIKLGKDFGVHKRRASA